MQDNIQDILFEGEHILWQGKPDKFCFIWRRCARLLPIAVIFLLFDSFFISNFFSGVMPGAMKLFMLVFFAFHLLPVWLFVGNFIKAGVEHKNIVYAVTDRRIILRSGVIGMDFENINYSDISNIKVDVAPIEKLRKVGSVYFTTSSGSHTFLLSIPEPYEVYKRVNKIFMDMKSDIHFPNAYRPEINPGYNTKYEEK